MSKLLKKERLEEENSFHISQIAAGIDAQAVAAVNAAGLSLASTKVITSADEVLDFFLGKFSITHDVFDNVIYGYRGHGVAEYGLIFAPNFDMFINAGVGRSLKFRNNNFNRMVLTGSSLTMSVPIVLSGAPTIDLHASTKKYVDDQVVSYSNGSYTGDGGSQTINANLYKDMLIIRDSNGASWHKRLGMATYFGIDLADGIFKDDICNLSANFSVGIICNVNGQGYTWYGVM